MTDLVKLVKQAQAEIRSEGHAGWGNLLDLVLEVLSAPVDGEVADVRQQIESAVNTCDDEIHGYDYHIYCTLREALDASDDLIERLWRECEKREDQGRVACSLFDDLKAAQQRIAELEKNQK